MLSNSIYDSVMMDAVFFTVWSDSEAAFFSSSFWVAFFLSSTIYFGTQSGSICCGEKRTHLRAMGWLDQIHFVEIHRCSQRRTWAGFALHCSRKMWGRIHINIYVTSVPTSSHRTIFVNVNNKGYLILKLPNASPHTHKKVDFGIITCLVWDILALSLRGKIPVLSQKVHVTKIWAFFFSLLTQEWHCVLVFH